MSQENVDRMRAAITAMNRRDIDPASLAWIPQFASSTDLPHCREGSSAWRASGGGSATWADHFCAWQIDCDDIRDLGDRVLALGTIRATGRESGVETDLPLTAIAQFKDRLITDFIDYGDREQALEAAGLRE